MIFEDDTPEEHLSVLEKTRRKLQSSNPQTQEYLRKSMSPMRLEAILFLHTNRDLWEYTTVHNIVRSTCQSPEELLMLHRI
jgi:hypothetical protein